MQKGDREGDLPSFRPPKLVNSAGRVDVDNNSASQTERLVGELGLPLFPREAAVPRKFTYSKETLLELGSRCLNAPPSMAEGLPHGFYSSQSLPPLCAPGPAPPLRSVGQHDPQLLRILHLMCLG